MALSMRFVVLFLALVHAASAATITVSMVNTRFLPANITINVGDTVTWRCDAGFHDTVSGVNGVPDGVWNSSSQFRPIMQPGQRFSFTFNTAGTYPYYCTPHWMPPLNMVGSVTVQSANAAPSVSIINPRDGANFSAPADITVEAIAGDPDGDALNVELFMNGSPIGAFSAPPYSAVVSQLEPGNYTFLATARDTSGATANSSVSITVSGQQPTITNGPESQTANVGSDVTFTVQAIGSQPLSYQWLFGSTPIPGANDTSLLLTNVTSANAGTYTVQVANNFGSTSASTTLTVTNPPSGTAPSITTHPESQTVNVGSNVTFTAAAIGSVPLRWQWFFNGGPIASATNASLEILAVTAADAGDYFATVANDFGSDVSSNATLTVSVPPVCEYFLSRDNASFEPAGGTDNVTVTAPADCPWTAVETNDWITITSGSSGNGPGSVSFSVASNSTRTARSGILVVAGKAFTIAQAAALFLAKNDFNHDGQTDFLWHHVDGRVSLWLMDGTSRISSRLLRNGRPSAPGSRIVGTHDFDMDQNVDILWQRTDGLLQVWLMNGENFLRSELIAPAPSLKQAWHVAGLGDFDRDLHADILLRHREGYLLIWYMRGKQFLRQSLLQNGEAIPLKWRVIGVADINKDGTADILWQNPGSAIVVWFMTHSLRGGASPLSGPLLAHLPRMSASIVGLNDLNQDGGLDFIWRHPDGHLSVWTMDGTNQIGQFPINGGQPISPKWRFSAPRN